METNFELSRWQEAPKGIGYRRWIIVSTGLRQMLRGKFFRLLMFFAWAGGAMIAVAGFVFSQAVANGGWLESLAAQFGPRFQAIAAAFTGVVLLYPDVCVHGLFTTIFWIYSSVGLSLCLLGLTTIVPRLVTRDRASNALTIYLARPLTSVDYLLGKIGIVAGVFLVLWTGPLLAGWSFSMLLSPNRDFLVYSLRPLGNALLFNGIALVSLAAISLGVSAISRSSRNASLLWIGLWLVVGAVGGSSHYPDWIRRASFSHDLGQIKEAVFALDRALANAADQLPLVSHTFSEQLKRGGDSVKASDAAGAAAGLSVLVVLSSVVFFRKLRPA